MKNNKVVFGSFEPVSVPDLGIKDVIAKVDTGAYSGALHCSKIREVVRRKDNKTVLRFTPLDKHLKSVEVEHYKRAIVRSSTGHLVKRYLFNTEIVINDIVYPILIGLSNRSDMKYEILIGRRFLRENNILVDVKINQEYDTDGVKSHENSHSIQRSR